MFSDHQQTIENAGQENVATEVVEEADEMFENGMVTLLGFPIELVVIAVCKCLWS